ncbi:T9SS type A sorting domain-containing protein [bacterium]|nr:T9SS type A sorting domain-containing protein [bacterium]
MENYNELPRNYALYDNYPNTFNPTTIIHYEIPKISNVTLTIYNMNGQVVERLVNQKQEPGFYSVNWDAGNVSTGVYFYRIEADGFQQVKKMLLIK